MDLENLLIIHNQKPIREMLKTYIMSEYKGINYFEASSSEEAFLQLQEKKFELVISSIDYGIDGLEIHQQTQSQSVNQETPFIMMTSIRTDKNLKKLAEQEITNYVIFPCPPIELNSMIKTAVESNFSLSEWYINEQIYVPDSKVILHLEEGDIETDLSHISGEVLLCDFIYTKHRSSLMDCTALTLQFSPEYHDIRMDRISCSLVRLNVLTWGLDYAPEFISVAWRIIELSNQYKKYLKTILERAFEETTPTG